MQNIAIVMQNSDEIDCVMSYESREEEGLIFTDVFDELCNQFKKENPNCSVDDRSIIFTMKKMGWVFEIVKFDKVYSGWVLPDECHRA